MARLEIVNPVAEPLASTDAAERFDPAPRPAELDGLRIGLFWNGKPQGDVGLAHTRALLERLYDDVTFVEVFGERGALARFAAEGQLALMESECDVVIGSTADCGSCTAWLVRDMVALERRGVPTVMWTSSEFVEDAHWSAHVFGLPELPLAEVKLPFTNRDPATIGSMVAGAMNQVLDGLTRGRERLATVPAFQHVNLAPEATFAYSGDDLLDACDRFNADFVARQWSDGLPLVPPTASKVAAMVEASGLAADHVVGVFAPGDGIGTVAKIAANAVMAGARPEHMPVILAVMECVLDPTIGLRTWAMSTGPQAPVVMVSGPYAREIGMNAGMCGFGPGSVSQVNVAIGRTLRLVMMNVGHSWPGAGDMDTIGTPLKFSACVAENEERNPWPSFRVLQGFPATSTTVTVNVPYGICELFDFQNYEPERLIEIFATVSSNSCASPSNGNWLVKTPADLSAGYPFSGGLHNLILMCPEHADAFATAGWTPDDICRAMWEKSVLPFRLLMINKPMKSFLVSHPELAHLVDAPDTPVPVFLDPSTFQVFVTGADAGRSLYFHGGTISVTKEVRLP
jgi:hypothetical protein